MILPDKTLRQWASSGGVTPFDPDCINPASIDLRWSGRLRYAEHDGCGNGQWSEIVDADELEICPGELYLLDTVETIIIPDDCSAQLQLKSTTARNGLNHLMAGWFECGFGSTKDRPSTGTLEIYNPSPWKRTIYKNQRLVQLVLHRMEELPEKTYRDTGRYNGQHGPEPARGER